MESSVNMHLPDLTDAFGTKWWLDPSASDYASRADARGITLGAEVWLIEELNGDRSFCLVKDRKVIFESKSLAEVGKRIDLIKKGAV